MFAPHASLRARVTAWAGKLVLASPPIVVSAPTPERPDPTRRRAPIAWARLLARIYQTRPLACPRCRSAMRLLAFLTEPCSIPAILAHLGEPTIPPPLAFDFDQSPPRDPTTPESGFAFDQTAP